MHFQFHLLDSWTYGLHQKEFWFLDLTFNSIYWIQRFKEGIVVDASTLVLSIPFIGFAIQRDYGCASEATEYFQFHLLDSLRDLKTRLECLTQMRAFQFHLLDSLA